jgi:ubiquinone/menaquinone biosynthesis C-methylase UbiE
LVAVLDYDDEAARYDESRGGEPRAEAAARAVGGLLPVTARRVVDVGCGTGLVTARLRAPGRCVVGTDRSMGMLRLASERLPGAAVRSDATALPLADASVDAVTMVWVLHLLDADTVGRVLAEAVRVLRPCGCVVSTVDKDAAGLAVDSDVAAVLRPATARYLRPPTDATDTLIRYGEAHGLVPDGRCTFVGYGQGRSPREWQKRVLRMPWVPGAEPHLARIRRELATLPDQDEPRPDPVYQVLRLSAPA